MAMSQKHLLLLVGGLLSFASFFMPWVSNGFNGAGPSSLISDPNEQLIHKFLFIVLLVSSAFNAYNGYTRKYGGFFVLVNGAATGWMLYAVAQTIITTEGSVKFSTGYFMSAVAILILFISLFASSKERVKSQESRGG